jgi:hypothetical protein
MVAPVYTAGAQGYSVAEKYTAKVPSTRTFGEGSGKQNKKDSIKHPTSLKINITSFRSVTLLLLFLVEIGGSVSLVAKPVLRDLFFNKPIAFEAIREGDEVSRLHSGSSVTMNNVHLARNDV